MRPAEALTNSSNLLKIKRIAKSEMRMRKLIKDRDPAKALQSGKLMAKAWSKTLLEGDHTTAARSFMHLVMAGFWPHRHRNSRSVQELPLLAGVELTQLDASVAALANAIGQAAGKLEIITASYELG
jgi:hypothetical protein